MADNRSSPSNDLWIPRAIVALALMLFSQVGHAANTCQSIFSAATVELSADLLREKVFAVHATNFIPHNGVIVADGRDLNIPILRPEIHFALGGLVRSHPSGNWESYKFAVVTPLQTIEPQLANLMVYDTVIYGDFQMPKQAVLIIPADVPTETIPLNTRVYKYPPHQTLRDAVDHVISTEHGWVLKSIEGQAFASDDAIISELGINLNSPSTLTQILRQHPQVTFQNADQSTPDVLSSWGRENLLNYFSMKEVWRISTAALKFEKERFDIFVSNIEREMDQLRLKGAAAQSRTKFHTKTQAISDLLSLEIELREKVGHSLFNSNPKLWMPKILPLLTSAQQLRNFAFTHANEMKSAPEGSDSAYAYGVAKKLLSLSSHDVQVLLQKLPDFVSIIPEGLEGVLNYHAVLRLNLIGSKAAAKEGLMNSIESAFQRAVKTPYGVASLLLAVDRTTLDGLNYLRTSPIIADILSKNYNLSKFDSITGTESNIDFMRVIEWPTNSERK